MARPSSLSAPSQQLVLDMLRKSRQPLTAYRLLARLKKAGVNSPPIVYRALASLMAQGRVHKITAQGTFVACNCAPGHDHSLSLLTVCQRCQRVEELHDHAVMRHLLKLRALSVMLPEQAVIELPVICTECA